MNRRTRASERLLTALRRWEAYQPPGMTWREYLLDRAELDTDQLMTKHNRTMAVIMSRGVQVRPLWVFEKIGPTWVGRKYWAGEPYRDEILAVMRGRDKEGRRLLAYAPRGK